MTYRQVLASSSLTCTRNRSNAIFKLVGLSGASKTQKAHVFLGELGCFTLHIWKDILKLPPPLSPPSLIHTSLSGILPSCHVNWCTLNRHITFFACTSCLYLIIIVLCYIHLLSGSSLNDSMSEIFAKDQGCRRVGHCVPQLNVGHPLQGSKLCTQIISHKGFRFSPHCLLRRYFHLWLQHTALYINMTRLWLLTFELNISPSHQPQLVPRYLEVSLESKALLHADSYRCCLPEVLGYLLLIWFLDLIADLNSLIATTHSLSDAQELATSPSQSWRTCLSTRNSWRAYLDQSEWL